MAIEEPTDLINERLPSGVGRRKQLWMGGLALLVAGMFGFAYLNAEFFVMICQKIGLLDADSSSLRGTIVEGEPGRPIDVYFAANVGDNLPMAFRPARAFQKTRLNVRTINDYTFVNLSNEEIYFRPVHSVSPMRAGREGTMVLEKCFCFDEQKIGPGETYTLPIVYSFTENLDENTHTIQMNYTLFRSNRANYEAFYARAENERPKVYHGDEVDS